MIHRSAHLGLSLVAVLAAGCDELDTAVLIDVDSDLGSDLTRVEVAIRDASDQRTLDRFSFDSEQDAQYRVPFSFRIEPRSDPNGAFVLAASGYRRSEFLSEAKLRIEQVEGTTQRIGIRLLAACRNVHCEDGESCDPASATCGELGSSAGPRVDAGAGRGGRSAPNDGGAGRAGASEQDAQPPAAGSDGGAAGDDPAADGGMIGGGGSGAGSGGAGGMSGGGGAGAGGRAGGGSGGMSGGGGAGSGGMSGRGAAGSGGMSGRGGAGSGAGGMAGNAGAGSGGMPAAGGGGSGGSGVLTGMSDFASVEHDGRNYIVQNNVYGPGASQTLSYEGTSFTITSLTGDDPNGVAFPSVYIGSVYNRATSGSNLPKQVSAIQGIDLSFGGNAGSVSGTYHSLAALWLSAGSTPDSNLPSGGVLEVWFHVQTAHDPPGSVIAEEVSISGVAGTWDVWQGTCFDHPCVFYVRKQSLKDFQGDLLPFLRDAVQRPNALDSSAYVNSVFAGFDIHNGGVGLHASDISALVR